MRASASRHVARAGELLNCMASGGRSARKRKSWFHVPGYMEIRRHPGGGVRVTLAIKRDEQAARSRAMEEREAIQRWKPWKRSTGPKSPEGKARVSRNGWKGGTRELLREVARVLREQRETVERR